MTMSVQGQRFFITDIHMNAHRRLACASYLLGWFTKNKIGIFSTGHFSFCSFLVIKIILAKYEKKSLGGTTGQWTFVHKDNGIYGPFSLQHKTVVLIFPDCAKN